MAWIKVMGYSVHAVTLYTVLVLENGKSTVNNAMPRL